MLNKIKILMNCITVFHHQKLPKDATSWIPDCLTMKSSPSAFTANWPGALLPFLPWIWCRLWKVSFKKKLISATKYMPWSPWKDILLHSKSQQHPSMTGKTCGTLWNHRQGLSSSVTRDMSVKPVNLQK